MFITVAGVGCLKRHHWSFSNIFFFTLTLSLMCRQCCQTKSKSLQIRAEHNFYIYPGNNFAPFLLSQVWGLTGLNPGPQGSSFATYHLEMCVGTTITLLDSLSNCFDICIPVCVHSAYVLYILARQYKRPLPLPWNETKPPNHEVNWLQGNVTKTKSPT